MTRPASGLYGPGDYGPGFVTIDDDLRMDSELPPEHRGGFYADRAWFRGYAVAAILDLAADLDARGLVLVDRDTAELGETFRAGLNYVGDTLLSLSPEAQAMIDAEMA